MGELILDTLARGIAIGAMIALGAGLWAGGGRSPARLAGAIFALSVIAYIVNSSPSLIAGAGWLAAPIHFLALGGAGMFWLFIVALFEDRPPSPSTVAPWGLLTAVGLLGLAANGSLQRGVWVAHNVIEVGLALHALYVIARSWRGDLVEARRRLRGPFLAIVTLYVLTLSGFEIAESLGYFETWFRTLGAVSLALYCSVGAVVFLQARPALFGAASPSSTDAADRLDAVERNILARLEQAIGAGQAWKREGLTIGALADMVVAPERRLRRLINDRRGFRNFAGVVNAGRIAAAKAALSDPNQAGVSVSAIAFELGFASLGPFNRAFKRETGLTPTQWRRQERGESSPNPENPG